MKTGNVLNVRAYKIIYPSRMVVFQTKSEDGPRSFTSTTIESLANKVKGIIENFTRDGQNAPLHVTIDLRPYHDIEFEQLVPKRCLALTEEEVNEFWSCYNK